MLGFVAMLGYSCIPTNPTLIIWTWKTFHRRWWAISFLVDRASLSFVCVLLVVAGYAFVYRTDYLGASPNTYGFYLALGVFTLRIVLLILSADLLTLFIAWDGLGIRSFLLVAYYDKARRAAGSLLTILTNRLGDGFLCLAVAISLFSTRRWFPSGTRGIAGVFFIAAAFSKRAQWPLCAWLPAAMAAPTPISALVHSSTLVTAGIYLLVRVEGCVAPVARVAGLAAATFFLASVGACLTFDLKRLIAISTLRHLGFIVGTFFAGDSRICIYHLWVHALFKSVLFIAAGNFIQAAGHSQDLRDIGSLLHILPLSSTCAIICITSLASLPVSSAFFSKSLGLANTYSPQFVFYGCLTFLAATFSIFYCVRIIYFLTNGTVNGAAIDARGAWIPLASLCVLTFVASWVLRRMVASSSLQAGSVWSGWELSAIIVGLSTMWVFHTPIQDKTFGHFGGTVSGHRAIRTLTYEFFLAYVRSWEQNRLERAVVLNGNYDSWITFMIYIQNLNIQTRH